MRPFILAFVVSLIPLLDLSSPAASLRAVGMSRLAGDLPHFDDAPLRAVRFVDENEGWAVGDEGTIWHTIDGGDNWERQPSGTRASLCGLCFVDPFTGYVVGRESLPVGQGSVGVVLFTRDGGVKWQRITDRDLPGLRAVKFLDRKNGVILGDASDQYPTGVFVTEDGGQSWKPVAGPRCPGWRAADFLSSQLGTLAGAWGSLAVFRGGAVALGSGLNERTIRAVQYCGTTPFAVGDGGLALINKSPGETRWTPLGVGMPAELQMSWDFHTLGFAGDHGWIAGRPGSVVLHTPDKGQTWEVQKTGQTLPLHGLCFVNAKRGWAVGELGTILATQDGGKTWKPRRRGGHRAAILCITAEAEGLPAAAVAALGADSDEGYLVAAVRVTSADPATASPTRANDDALFTEATALAGGCGAETLWQFPLPRYLATGKASDLTKVWGKSAEENLQRHMVLALRTWRPEVVLVSGAGEVGSMIPTAVHQGCELAGKADAFPEQIAQLDLQPWAPKKVYAAWPTQDGPHVVLDCQSPRPGLGGSAQDRCAAALSLLGDPPATSPAHYRLLASSLDGAENHKGLMDGVRLEFGGQARREKWKKEDADWAQIQKAAQQRRDLQAIANFAVGDATRARQMVASVDKALTGLSEEQAGEAVYAIGEMYVKMGQWLLAKEIFLLLADRFPAHRRVPTACRWLVYFTSSSEARRREELKNFYTTSSYQFQALPAPDAKAVAQMGLQGSQATLLMRRQDDVRAWNKAALVIGDLMAAQGPVYYGDPAIQFALHSAQRALGQPERAAKWYAQFKARHDGDAWANAAGAEIWPQNPVRQCPKPALSCARTTERPYLDGKLDEAIWKNAQPVVFQNAAGQTAEQYPTEAWLAYDDEFLFLALRCKHPDGKRVPPAKSRKHDEDLRPYDRVSLMLDLDRDYATYFQLQVDQRGCVAEDCWGDKSWDPKWFVAIQSDATSWQVEAAIPLTELTAEKPRLDQAWCCNLVRTIPGQGVQALSLPADAEPRPEGMGLLLFTGTPSTAPESPPPKRDRGR